MLQFVAEFLCVAGHHYYSLHSIILNSYFMSMKKDRVIDLSMSKLNLVKDARRQIVSGMSKKAG